MTTAPRESHWSNELCRAGPTKLRGPGAAQCFSIFQNYTDSFDFGSPNQRANRLCGGNSGKGLWRVDSGVSRNGERGGFGAFRQYLSISMVVMTLDDIPIENAITCGPTQVSPVFLYINFSVGGKQHQHDRKFIFSTFCSLIFRRRSKKVQAWGRVTCFISTGRECSLIDSQRDGCVLFHAVPPLARFLS